MAKPEQGSLALLQDEVAQRLLASREVAHLAYTWTDGTPRCIPIWFHWNGTKIVIAGPANAPRVHALADGVKVAVTIDSASWPYSVLMIRGSVSVDELTGVAPEYRAAAARYFGEEQGAAWCAQLPADMPTARFTITPEWVGLLDFDGMRRLPSALAG
jgi:Pyridoxamine 5'-phosphate oxidase